MTPRPTLRQRAVLLAATLLSLTATSPTHAQATRPAAERSATSRPALAQPVVEGRWLRPAPVDGPAIPEWGHADGLRVGLAPLPGPRGLLRVYAPYLGQAEPTLLNFVAVEPTPAGARGRGLSELEPSKLDPARGKRFWSADAADAVAPPRAPEQPARGVVEVVDGVEQLTVFVGVERFDNGAHNYLRLRFRADRPHEFGIAVYAHPDSVPLDTCIVTATMGNYARLRSLQLRDRVVRAPEIWPAHRGDGFTPHAMYGLEELTQRDDGEVYVSATPDEADPSTATYAEGTRRHWRFAGTPARQWWRMARPPERTVVAVNGRVTYWASQSPIPGGVSFENFELIAPFAQGHEFWFGAEPRDAPSTADAHAQ